MAYREAWDVGDAVRFEVSVDKKAAVGVAAIFGCGHLKVAATFFGGR